MELIIKYSWWIGLVALILNFTGALPIAFSFGKNISEAYSSNEKGRKIYLASFLHPGLFRLGVILLAVGFLLQIIIQLTIHLHNT